MNVIPIGPFKLERRDQTPSIKCPLCKRMVRPEDHIESRVRVVRKGKPVGWVREVIAECCAKSYLVSE